MRVCERPGCEREIPEDAREDRIYCDGRCRTKHYRLKQEKPRRVKPSGRQVSYRKAVGVMAEAFCAEEGWPGPTYPIRVWGPAYARAESILSEALPERQRAMA